MHKYRRVVKAKEKSVSADDEIRVTANGRTSVYVAFANTLFNEKKMPTLTIKATGTALSTAVTLAEVIKRRFKGLHQIAKLGSILIEEQYEPLEEGLDMVTDARKVSYLEIILSKDELDKKDIGYQPPLDDSLVKEYYTPEEARERRQERMNEKSSGQQRGRSKKGKSKSGKGKGAKKDDRRASPKKRNQSGKGGKAKSSSQGKGKSKGSKQELEASSGRKRRNRRGAAARDGDDSQDRKAAKGRSVAKGKSKLRGKGDSRPQESKGKGKSKGEGKNVGKSVDHKGYKSGKDEWRDQYHDERKGGKSHKGQGKGGFNDYHGKNQSKGGSYQDNHKGGTFRGGLNDSKGSGYSDRRGYQDQRQGGFQSKGNSYDRDGGFQSKGGFQDRMGGYQSKGGFQDKRQGGFQSKGSSFQDNRQGGYNPPGRSFHDNHPGGFSNTNSYHQSAPYSPGMGGGFNRGAYSGGTYNDPVYPSNFGQGGGYLTYGSGKGFGSPHQGVQRF